jgi:hypothetical protein
MKPGERAGRPTSRLRDSFRRIDIRPALGRRAGPPCPVRRARPGASGARRFRLRDAAAHMQAPGAVDLPPGDPDGLRARSLQARGPLAQREGLVLAHVLRVAHLKPRRLRDQSGLAHRRQFAVRDDVTLGEAAGAEDPALEGGSLGGGKPRAERLFNDLDEYDRKDWKKKPGIYLFAVRRRSVPPPRFRNPILLPALGANSEQDQMVGLNPE